MNIAVMKVEEIRALLVNEYGYTEEQVAEIKGKTALAIALKKEIDANSKLENSSFFSEIPKEEVKLKTVSETSNNEKQEENIPVIGGDGWEDYVLSKLRPEEIEIKGKEKYPKVPGLRRVAQLLLGDIVSSRPVQVFPPVDPAGPGRATVVYEIQIRWRHDVPEYVNLEKFEEPIRIFAEAADAWIGNTPDTFAVHPVATASSRAEGRALKKALQLSVLVAEEMNNDKDAASIVEAAKSKIQKEVNLDDTRETGIAEQQVGVITSLCERNKVDLKKLIEKELPNVVIMSNIDDVFKQLTRQDGAFLLKKLNQYQTKTKTSLEVPEEVKVEE